MYSAAQASLDVDLFAGAVPGFGRSNAPSARLRAPDLDAYRPMLTKYARRWLSSAADVEDVVQDTLVAALGSPQGFAGRSTPKTWLHGILKHKIVDTYRRQAREPLRSARPEDELRDEVDAMFTPDGRWRNTPTAWGDPEAALGQREFHEVLDECLAGLPVNAARVFRLRELMQMEVDEIGRVLDLSTGHCHVLLHRARLRLRTLLEQRWFPAPSPC
jgi:RNA polymerase sigma-70 factor (TIGR02943 family)